LAGDRRRAGGRELVEPAAYVRPAECEGHGVSFGQGTITRVAVDLEHADEAVEMCDWPSGLAVRSIDIGNTRRTGPCPWTVIAGISERLAGLGSAATGIENRRCGLVGEQLGRALQDGEQPLVHRSQKEGSAAHPVGEGRTVEGDALASIDL